MNKVLLTQKGRPLGGVLQGFGPLAETERFASSIENAAKLFGDAISLFVGILTISAGIWFVFQFFFGAFGWLTAGADKTAIENAQKRILNSVFGIAIVVAAIFLIDLLGRLIGLEILSPGKFIRELWSK